MKKILILNGPNLNLLGVREPEIYGKEDYKALCLYCEQACAKAGVSCVIFQTNHEGVLIDKVQEAVNLYDGIILNAAGYTHTSIALADAVAAVPIPTVEVHLTDISTRESFRRRSFITPVAKKCFMGEGFRSYRRAIDFLADMI